MWKRFSTACDLVYRSRMGNWNISVRGIGPHHNEILPTDADKMAKSFVRELIAAGHKIASAEITHGGADDLLPPSAQPSPPVATGHE